MIFAGKSMFSFITSTSNAGKASLTLLLFHPHWQVAAESICEKSVVSTARRVEKRNYVPVKRLVELASLARSMDLGLYPMESEFDSCSAHLEAQKKGD